MYSGYDHQAPGERNPTESVPTDVVRRGAGRSQDTKVGVVGRESLYPPAVRLGADGISPGGQGTAECRERREEGLRGRGASGLASTTFRFGRAL